MIEYGTDYTCPHGEPPEFECPRCEVVVHDNEMHRGQLRFAERFVVEHTGRMIFAHGVGWHVWDGTRWGPDRDGEPIRAAVETVKAARREIGRGELSKDDAKDLLEDLDDVEKMSGLKGMLGIAGCLRPLAVPAGDLDSDAMLFNVANGTLDLGTGEVKKHDPKDLITKRAGCALDVDAVAPTFERFLAEVLPDPEVRGFVQRLFGYALLGKVREHVLPIFTGVGLNGKSTLLDAVHAAFGDYAVAADPDLLVERNGAHPTGQADLLGVRLAISHETDEGRKLASATVKRLTGGDKIRARKMRMDFFEFSPSHTIILITNHKPQVAGDDPALWRRIRVIPFDVVVSKPDPTLGQRIAEELPGVLAWAYRGYLDYAENGLAAPEAVVKRTDAYRTDSDALGRFLDECTVRSSMASAKSHVLYKGWCEWCTTNGELSGTEVKFADSMKRRGFTKRHTNTGKVWDGLGLRSDGL